MRLSLYQDVEKSFLRRHNRRELVGSDRASVYSIHRKKSEVSYGRPDLIVTTTTPDFDSFFVFASTRQPSITDPFVRSATKCSN